MKALRRTTFEVKSGDSQILVMRKREQKKRYLPV